MSENYSAAVDGKNRSACWDCVIEAPVHALYGTIERPAGAKDVRYRRVDGGKKTAGPLPPRAALQECFVLTRLILIDRLHLRSIRLRELLWDQEGYRAVLAGADSYSFY